MSLESIEHYIIEHLGDEEDCPCCCHHEEEVACVREHGEGECCVVSELAEVDRCCYISDS